MQNQVIIKFSRKIEKNENESAKNQDDKDQIQTLFYTTKSRVSKGYASWGCALSLCSPPIRF